MESKGEEEEEDESTLELTVEYDDLELPPAKKLATEEDIAKERYVATWYMWLHILYNANVKRGKVWCLWQIIIHLSKFLN